MRRIPEIFLGFVIATALWSCILLWQSQKTAPSSQAEPAKTEQQHTKSVGTVVEQEQHSKRGQKSNWYDTFLNHTPDWFVAIFTGLLTFVTYRLVSTTGGLKTSTDRLWEAGERQIELSRETAAAQTRDMQDSIEVAQAAVKASQKSADAAELSVVEADRAWIEVEINILGPLIFGEEEIEVEAEAIFTNTGRSPAINVGYEFKLCTDVGEASSSASDSAKIMGRSFMSFLSSGQVIYPGKNAKIRNVLKVKRADFIARIKEIDAVESEDKTEPFVTSHPALMAFVWYGLPRAGKLGKYRFSTGLFEVCWTADAYKGFDGSVMTAPLDQIELVATYFSGEFA
jgi:hypothetical protein